MSTIVNYNAASPLELLYDNNFIQGIIVYKGSNPIDYYPYNLELNELIGFLNLLVTDRLNPLKDYIVVKIDDYYVLIMPLINYKSLTIIFKPGSNLNIIEKYHVHLMNVLSKLSKSIKDQ